jgi:hypothetical protein
MTSKKLVSSLIILLAAAFLLSCSDTAGVEIKNPSDIKLIQIYSGPEYIESYHSLTPEIEEILVSAYELTAEQEKPVALSAEDTDLSAAEGRIHIGIDYKGGDNQMIGIYIFSDKDGIIRCFNNSSDGKQTMTAFFEFQDRELIEKTREMIFHLDSKKG